MTLSNPHKILVVDDDPDILKIFGIVLAEEGYEPLKAGSAEEGLELLRLHSPDVVFLDVMLPGISGIEALKKIKESEPDTPVVMLTASEKIETVVEAMKLGAHDYLSKPPDNEKIKFVIKRALESRRLTGEVGRLSRELAAKSGWGKIVALSPCMARVLSLAERAAEYDVTVLLQGESGTGKELFARHIHLASPRKNGPFVPIDCATLPETLVESELFGHEKGAFTGADKAKPGKFELADKGTVFLDEMGNLPLTVQVKLLRVLQEKEIVRLGGRRPIKIDARVIVASNADLDGEMEKGNFRGDLFHRINEFRIRLPSLRERSEDLPNLCATFLEDCNGRFGKHIRGFSARASSLLARYGWPGNVRELKNAVQRAVILCDEDTIRSRHLPAEVLRGKRTAPAANGKDDLSFAGPMTMEKFADTVLKKAEKDHLIKTLASAGGNKAKAARMLDIDYKTLFNKLNRFGIKG